MNHFLALFLNSNSLPHTSAGSFVQILNIFFEIMGALAFLMVVIGGFRYVIAGSNADNVAAARRQILYSVIGLVIIAAAASIVNFVLDKA